MHSGEHGAIALYVTSPKQGEAEAEEATAIVPEVFHDLAGEKAYEVTLPGKIGNTVLHEGKIVHGMGNRAAHSAEELAPHDLYVDPDDTWLNDQGARD